MLPWWFARPGESSSGVCFTCVRLVLCTDDYRRVTLEPHVDSTSPCLLAVTLCQTCFNANLGSPLSPRTPCVRRAKHKTQDNIDDAKRKPRNSDSCNIAHDRLRCVPALIGIGVVLAERIKRIVGANLQRTNAWSDKSARAHACYNARFTMRPTTRLQADLGLLPVRDVGRQLLDLRKVITSIQSAARLPSVPTVYPLSPHWRYHAGPSIDDATWQDKSRPHSRWQQLNGTIGNLSIASLSLKLAAEEALCIHR